MTLSNTTSAAYKILEELFDPFTIDFSLSSRRVIASSLLETT